MGDIVELPKRKRAAPRPTTPPRPTAALSIDAAAMLRSYEMARRGVTQLATSPLWRDRSMTALGVIR